ncbi:MAG: hypothetical protein IJ279_07515 [Clostridia bacterium]|nr:hypothetical protein [Clostridia bacterium]
MQEGKTFELNKKTIAILTAVLVVIVAAVIVIASTLSGRSDDEEEVTEETTLNVYNESIEDVKANDTAFFIKDNSLYMSVYPDGGTVQLLSGIEDVQSADSAMDGYIKLSENGKKVFYLDNIGKTGKEYGTLYCKSTDNLKEKAVKIAENVSEFSVLNDKHADSVAYLEGVADTLYYSDTKENKKIAQYVYSYQYAPEHEAFYYNSLKGLFYKEIGSKSEKIADDVWYTREADDGESCIFVKKEYSTSGKRASVYKKTVGMSVEQIVVNVNAEPFENTNVFYEDGSAYYLKYVKEKGSNAEKKYFCYHDGYVETTIAENMVSYRCNENSPVAIYFDDALKTYLVDEGETTDITGIVGTEDQNTTIGLKEYDDGAVIVSKTNLLTNMREYYRIVIEDGEVTESELYDSGIADDSGFSLNEESVNLYYKNLQQVAVDRTLSAEEHSRLGDLYVNKQLVAQGAEVYRVSYNEDFNRICYYTNWNAQTKKGTLNLYDDEEIITVADNVSAYQITDKGNVLFVSDGGLYVYSDGKTTQLESGNISLSFVYHPHTHLNYM